MAQNYSTAMDWLEKTYEAHDAVMPYIGTSWFSEGPFKINDPRFNKLLERMNLPLTSN